MLLSDRQSRELTARVVLPKNAEVDTDEEEAIEEEERGGVNGDDLLEHFPDDTEVCGWASLRAHLTNNLAPGSGAITLENRFSRHSQSVAIRGSSEEALPEAELDLIPGPCGISSTYTVGRTRSIRQQT